MPQHLLGKLNVEAGWLSRLSDRGPMPPTLAEVKLRRTTALSEKSLSMIPLGMQGSQWVQALPHPNGVYDSL